MDPFGGLETNEGEEESDRFLKTTWALADQLLAAPAIHFSVQRQLQQDVVLEGYDA
jgi:hypothetical protein